MASWWTEGLRPLGMFGCQLRQALKRDRDGSLSAGEGVQAAGRGQAQTPGLR